MELRLAKHNASMHRVLWCYKIQYRRIGDRNWKDYFANGRMIIFDFSIPGRERAVEYMRQIRFPGVEKTSVVQAKEYRRRQSPRINLEDTCYCHHCSNEFNVDICLPDEIWKKIVSIYENIPGQARIRLLCPQCIVEAIDLIHKNDHAYDLTKVGDSASNNRDLMVSGKLERIKPVGFSSPTEDDITKEAIKYSKQLAIYFTGESSEDHDIIMFRYGANYILNIIQTMLDKK